MTTALMANVVFRLMKLKAVKSNGKQERKHLFYMLDEHNIQFLKASFLKLSFNAVF